MSTFEEAGVQSGEESIGGDHPQNSMGQLARLLGRPKASQGVKMNGTIGVLSSEQRRRHCLSMQARG